MSVRYLLTRRWLAGLAVLATVLLVVVTLLDVLGAAASSGVPGELVVLVAVAVAVTTVVAVGWHGRCTDRTPYW